MLNGPSLADRMSRAKPTVAILSIKLLSREQRTYSLD